MSRPSAIALFLGLLVVCGALAAGSPGASGAGEIWSARLLDLTSSYGSEAWKYDVGYEGQAAPSIVASHIENRSTSYYGALGLRVTLKIQLFKTDDANAKPTSSHNLSAYIDTARGPVYALVKREGTSANFFLDFDMDGANNAAPNGATPPPVEQGIKAVKVNIFRRASDSPSVEPAGEAQFQFTYEIPYGTASVESFSGLVHQQPVPDNIFRLFTDIGWDRSVQAFFRPIDPGQSINVSYEFSPQTSGQAVELYGFLAERGASSQAPAPAPGPTPPFVPGVSDNQTLQSLLHNSDRLVIINKKLLATSHADANGAVQFLVRGQDLLAIKSQAPASALVVLSPSLVENFDPAACPGDCRGGAQYRVGATEFVVPISRHRVDAYSFRLQDPSLAGGQAPGPIRDIAIGANALQFKVRDVEGYPAPQTRAGDVYAVVPDARSATPLSGARLSPADPPSDPSSIPTFLSGDLPVRSIQAQHVSFYRVLGLLYDGNDAFYGMTFADRGYTVQLNAPPAIVPPGSGGVFVNLTSRTTNYDVQAEDPSFEIQVFYSLRAPDLQVNESRNFVLREARTTSDFVPFTSGQAGSFRVTLESTSGDVLPRPNSADAVFQEAKPKKGFVDRIPGFEVAALVAALALVLLLPRRR